MFKRKERVEEADDVVKNKVCRTNKIKRQRRLRRRGGGGRDPPRRRQQDHQKQAQVMLLALQLWDA